MHLRKIMLAFTCLVSCLIVFSDTTSARSALGRRHVGSGEGQGGHSPSGGQVIDGSGVIIAPTGTGGGETGNELSKEKKIAIGVGGGLIVVGLGSFWYRRKKRSSVAGR